MTAPGLIASMLVLLVATGPLAAAPFPEPAFSSDQFVDSIGLNAAPFERYLDSGPFKGVGTHYSPELFFDLGVRYYRTGLKNDLVRPEAPDLITDAFHKYGVRPLMLIDPNKTGSPGDLVVELKKYSPGVIWGVEGPNEVNNKFPPQELNLKYKGKTDEAAAAAYMDDAVAAMRADPVTRDLPVVAFTAIFTDYRLARPHVSFDFANMHSYQGYDVPSSSLLMNETRFNNLYAAGYQLKPFVPTECGYNFEQDISNGSRSTGSRAAQALNIPMLYAEYFRHGIARTFLFALHNADGYGLLESDQATRRPSWFAVKSFIAQLSDAKWNTKTQRWEGGLVAPRALLFDAKGAPETVHALTLQKQDGSYRVLVWNEVPNFDANTRQDLKPEAVPVTLVFQRPLAGEVDAFVQNQQGSYDESHLATQDDGKLLKINVPSSVMILAMRQNVEPGVPPSEVTGAGCETTENEVTLHWAAPAPDSTSAGYFIFRNGDHVGTVPTQETRWCDQSAWVRPGLGYRYEIQSFDADGRMSARVPVLAVTPDRRPDLIVTATGTTREGIKPGEDVQFWATIKNVGSGATPYGLPLATTFTVDGKTISWGGIDRPLNPGEEVRITGGGGPRQPFVWKAETGAHLLLARVDDINRISDETCKTNNWIDQTLTIDPAGIGELVGCSRPAPSSLDLASGELEDWVVWGLGGKNGRVLQAGGPSLFGALQFAGAGYLDSTVGGPVHLSWNRGNPVVLSQGSNDCLWMNTKGHAFHFDTAADEHERELNVYVAGLEGVTGHFRAELSDGSAPPYDSSSWTGNLGNGDWAAVPDGFSAVFTMHYRASRPGEKLKIAWELQDEPNRFLGQIRLEAATVKLYSAPSHIRTSNDH